MKKRVEEWISYAIKDLNSAKKLSEDPSLNQNAAFHCQQAIEKIFKAVIEEEIKLLEYTILKNCME